MFSDLHLFLQGIRCKHRFIGARPYEVLICNLHNFSKEFGEFHIWDNLFLQTIVLRVGDVGIIVSLKDGELIRNTFSRYIKEVGDRKLHPLQFYELYAKVNYQISLRKNHNTYITSSHIDGEDVAASYTNVNYFLDDWVQKDFYEVLKETIKLSVNKNILVEFLEPDRVTSWMADEHGELLFWSSSGELI